MITLFAGEFMLVPEALDVSHNWCSHNCGYCFANLNKPDRRIDPQKLFNQITNFRHQKNEVAMMLQHDMVVTASNKTDPFAKTNEQISLPMFELFEDYGIKHSIQTRGGSRIYEYLDMIKSTKVFYISITHTSDETRKNTEVGSPTIESRWELVDELLRRENKVIVAYNPFWHEWINIDKEIENCTSRNLSGVVLQKMHINNLQYSNMTPRYKEVFKDIYDKSKSSKSRLINENHTHYTLFYNTLRENGVKVKGYSETNFDNIYSVYADVYGKNSTFRTKEDFYVWCLENKKDGDEVRFKEFYDFFSKDLPFKDKEINLTPFFRSVKTIDKSADTYTKKKGFLRDVIEVFWNDWTYKRHLTMSRNYSILLETHRGQKYRLVDENNNLIYVFHKEKQEHVGTEYSNQRLNLK